MKFIAIVFSILVAAKVGKTDSKANTVVEYLIPVTKNVNYADEQDAGISFRGNENTYIGVKGIHGFFPYQAAVISDDVNFCSGTLIKPKFVLTAAHCVSAFKRFDVTVGMRKLGSVGGVQEAKTKTVHEKYDPYTMENDLAILAFNKSFTITTWVNTITPMPETKNKLKGNWARASGWGGPSGIVEYLHYVDLNVISNEECKKTFDDYVTDNFICASSKNNRATCMVDGGSPLVDLTTGQLIGVASVKSHHGCKGGVPVFYVRVSSYSGWITNNTKET